MSAMSSLTPQEIVEQLETLPDVTELMDLARC